MPRHFYLIIGFVVLLAATIGLMVAAIFFINEDTGMWSVPDNSPAAPSASTLVPQPAPEVTIYRTGTAKRPTLTITWKNLAKDTVRINVFRSGACAIDEWTLWKIINVYGMSDGIVEIALKLSEANCTFSYYTETTNGSGNVNWRSAAGPASTNIPPDLTVPTSTVATVSDPPPQTPPPAAPPPSAPPPTATSTPTSTPSASPTSTATSTSGSSTSTAPGPDQHTYYTPQSTVSGYENPPAGEFWVQHTHQYIEIGWQNLPATTGRIIVYRGDTTTGPWEVLLDQTSPDPTGPYIIRLSDDSITDPHYYRLEAQHDGIVTGSYGPYLLQALAP
ncbi:MAG: hypothetical protein RL681_281 [Candidatus Parcubacteria bacterium]|jgi:hypothetical protein